MLSKAKNLLGRLGKYEAVLGKNAKKLHQSLDACILNLEESQKNIRNEMEQVWIDLDEAQKEEDIKGILSGIARVMNYSLPLKDLQDYEELKEILDLFMQDIQAIKNATNDRIQLKQVITEISDKYSNSEMDFDVVSVLEDVINRSQDYIDQKDQEWRTRNLVFKNKQRETIHDWIENTRVLPAYLKQETIDLVIKMRIEANEIISNAKIDDVLYYYDKLNDIEKKKCIELLLDTSQR